MSNVPMPPDVLAEILSWLPVTSLLRFRSVSKTFRALIDSDYVIKLHLNHSVQTNSNTNIIFSGDRSFCYLNLDSSANVVTNMHNPLYSPNFETVILGSCNGVVCLCTVELDSETAFWNPLLGKFKKTRLPPARHVEGRGWGASIKGFGYDHVHDDYKVVRLVQYYSLFEEFVVHSRIDVFSLKTDALREIGDFPYHLCHRSYLNCFVNGALHWLVSQDPNLEDEFLIAAFDLTNDELRVIPQPDFANEKVQVSLGILGGCLCMVCNYPNTNVDVWVMKSYGVKDSWSKLISTADVKIIRDLDFLRPIAYSKSGHQVLLEKNIQRLYWYDLVNKTAKRFKVAGMPRVFVTQMFTGSLVRVDFGSASKSGTKKENKNNKRKNDFLSKGFRLVL